MVKRRRFTHSDSPVTPALTAAVRSLARPLRTPDDLDPLMERIGDARCVLLGEASHGTADYYTWRAALSRRLIEEKGFSFVGVEGDWPDCYRVNRYVKGYPDAESAARDVLHVFERWPTWMWANEEIVAFAEWLHGRNDGRPEAERVGFYGLDVYSLWDSLYQVMTYLRKEDPSALPAAWRAYLCFEPYGEDVQDYARATAFAPESCENEVVELLRRVREDARKHDGDGRDGRFEAEQNALVVRNAEAYYRAMVHGGPDSWNVRDRHMAETLDRLLEHHGARSRAIVWEHNTHVGDARYTDMADEGSVNVGQLARERYGEGNVVLVGFGSHRGRVIAGREWDAPMERMRVPAARADSWEDVLHRAGDDDKLLIFGHAQRDGPFAEPRGHRAIGVVYHPEYERLGNYVPTELPGRYDAFLFIDKTEALHPLHLPALVGGEAPETYPSGV